MARKQAPAALARQAAQDMSSVSGSSLGSVSGLRQQMLSAAGISDSELALLTRRVINKFAELLSARTVQRLVVNDGLHHSEVREFVDEDGALQARAAAELVDILGLKPSRQQSLTATGPMTINVTFAQRPDSTRQVREAADQTQVIDVTPQKD